MDNNVSEKKSVYELSTKFIDKRIYKLKEKIDSLNSVISDYKISNGVYMPENQTNSALNNLNEIEQKIFNNSLQSELSLKLLAEVKKQSSFELLPTDIGIENENINQMVFQFNKIILEKKWPLPKSMMKYIKLLKQLKSKKYINYEEQFGLAVASTKIIYLV